MLAKVKEELRQRHAQFLQQQQQAKTAAALHQQLPLSSSPQQPPSTPTPPVGSSMSPATPGSSSAATPGPPDLDMQESETSTKSKDEEKCDTVEKMEIEESKSNVVIKTYRNLVAVNFLRNKKPLHSQFLNLRGIKLIF